MCRNLKFLHMTDFFSTGTARDKYQVCPKLSRMTHTWESLTHRDLNRLDWVPKIRKPAPLALFINVCMQRRFQSQILTSQCLPPDKLTTTETDHGCSGTERECETCEKWLSPKSHVTSSRPPTLCTKPDWTAEVHRMKIMTARDQKILENWKAGNVTTFSVGAWAGAIYSLVTFLVFLFCVHKWLKHCTVNTSDATTFSFQCTVGSSTYYKFSP